MNLDNLNTMKRPELNELAGKLGLHPHHRCKDETVVKMIKEAAFKKPEMAHAAERPQPPEQQNTPEQVEEAIKNIKARRPQFEATYNLEENTWRFSCLGSVESGNLAIPLRIIKMKADSVAQGARRLLAMQHFEPGNAGGNSAYTNNVLNGDQW